MICQGGHDPAAWGKYESDASVLPWEVASTRGDEAKPLFLRVTFAHPQPTADPPSISLLWRPIGPPPPPPPPAPKPTLKYVGCYVDASERTMNNNNDANGNDVGAFGDLGPLATTHLCADMCAGYQYFGLQYSAQCFCGNEYDGGDPRAIADGGNNGLAEPKPSNSHFRRLEHLRQFLDFQDRGRNRVKDRATLSNLGDNGLAK